MTSVAPVKKLEHELENRVKKLEDRVKNLEGHVDKNLKLKKKKLPKALSAAKAAQHELYKKKWADHERLFNEAKAKFPDGRFLPGTNDELIAARRALRKEQRKFRTRKAEEDIDAIRGERDMRSAEAFHSSTVGPSAAEIRRTKFPEADARYGVRPPVRASALGASVGSGLRYGRRF